MEDQHQPQPYSSVDDWEHQLRRYLLLLASLAATVTYAAGLDPPGGTWVESDGEKMAVAGDSILRATHPRRYLAFYYSNATALAASLVVILLLLVSTNRNRLETIRLRVLRLVMVLDLLALMVAYTAGSCREKVATIYTAALVAALSAYVGIHVVFLADGSSAQKTQAPPPSTSTNTDLEQLRKVLMLLAIFAATITYNAGLKPPGGFWEDTNGLHRPGEVILKHKHSGRFAVFFFSNTAAFIASLFTVVLLLDKKLTASATRQQLLTRYGFVVVTTLVTLVAAYAAGSCRNTATTTYTVALVAAVLVSIFLAAVVRSTGKRFMEWLRGGFGRLSINGDEPDESLKEKRSLVLLLGTLAASITYQAGLNPPGGVWLENQYGSHGHNAGDPRLLNTDDKRYRIFFYCNSTAFVASIVVILMVQIKALLKRNALHVAMILDLFGLMGAYIAGSSRTLRASVHVIILAAAFLVYVTGTYLHVKLTSTPNTPPNNSQNRDDEKRLKKRRKRLLLFAILMAAISYQAGLSPPGGFWAEQGQGHSSVAVAVGSPILEDMYPRRYQAFFYCNAISFMASMALIILLQDKNTYQPAAAGNRFYFLYACMVVGMQVLMGAYAAGSARRLRTSIYVFVLVGAVSVFIAVLFALFLLIRPQQGQGMSSNANGGTPENNDDDDDDDNHRAYQSSNTNGGGTAGNEDNNDNLRDHQSPNTNGGGTAGNDDNNDNHCCRGHHTKRKYVMLLAMLAASVTYQAGLDPPGGVWPDGYAAGSSVLHDRNLRRYDVFFYSNSTSFVASIVVIMLLLQSELPNMQSVELQQNLLVATNIVVALDLIGLLVAYAAGSSRTMDTSLCVIVLVVAVVIYIVVQVRLPAVEQHTRRQR